MNGYSNGVTDSQPKYKRVIVDSPYVRCDGNEMETRFLYRKNHFSHTADGLKVTPKEHEYVFKTQLKPKRTGVLLVGIGGNNGSTSVGAIIANKKHMTWRTKEGIQTANYFGSVTQSSTVHLGWDGQQQIHVPFKEIIPILSPNDLIIDGWDINNQNLYQAMIRAKLRPYMEPIVPMPSIYYPDFIAANQECVIVLWTANTERYTDVVDGLNMTVLSRYAIASVDGQRGRDLAFEHFRDSLNLGRRSLHQRIAPKYTRARYHRTRSQGDDFKSGQTKIKSALVDFLVSSGLKPESIVSYNHLGNNDGKNLSEARQFRSKEISKSSVVDDMVEANKILYPTGQKPDHCIVIKYVPFVGDSKRAMDEYICSIFMGGRQTFVIHNTCEDSLLATPLIYDLAILTELATRIRYADASKGEFGQFHEVLSILSLLLKAPVVPPGTPVGNAFMRQFASLTKLITTLAGIASDTDMQIEFFHTITKS
ncbi:inositol-3-phosphate synthase [Ostertagia ostertagi]